MSSTTPTLTCSGKCFPLYLYAAIAGLNIGAQFVWGTRPATQRLWSLAQSTFWAFLYGLLIYFVCRNCQTVPAYLLLVPPSVLFGLQMLLLLVRRPAVPPSPPPIVQAPPVRQ